MIQQIEYIENVIDKLDSLIKELKTENEHLLRENKELKNLIDDRDLEILQLQESVNKESEDSEGEKTEITNRLQGLLGRVQSMVAEEKKKTRNIIRVFSNRRY